MGEKWERLAERIPPLRLAYLLTRRYLRHSVGIQGAALAFYLLFGCFPLLIFLSALPGLLRLDVMAVVELLGRTLPQEAVALAEAYLRHVMANPSPRLLLFGLFFSLWFPMRAVNALMRAVRTAYPLGPPRRPVRHTLRPLVYTAVFIAALTLTLALMTVSDRLLHWGTERFGLPAIAAELWGALRFPAAAAVGWIALCFLYALAQDSRRPWREIWPGALAALAAWLALNWAYALYAANIADYSLLYGSIGTVMAVLVWLYLSGVTFIMGAECNAALAAMGRERKL